MAWDWGTMAVWLWSWHTKMPDQAIMLAITMSFGSSGRRRARMRALGEAPSKTATLGGLRIGKGLLVLSATSTAENEYLKSSDRIGGL
jgi:hypothetical protein